MTPATTTVTSMAALVLHPTPIAPLVEAPHAICPFEMEKGPPGEDAKIASHVPDMQVFAAPMHMWHPIIVMKLLFVSLLPDRYVVQPASDAQEFEFSAACPEHPEQVHEVVLPDEETAEDRQQLGQLSFAQQPLEPGAEPRTEILVSRFPNYFGKNNLSRVLTRKMFLQCESCLMCIVHILIQMFLYPPVYVPRNRRCTSRPRARARPAEVGTPGLDSAAKDTGRTWFFVGAAGGRDIIRTIERTAMRKNLLFRLVSRTMTILNSISKER